MEKGIAVKDITPGAEVRGIFAVTQAAQAQSRNGPYWRLTLADAGGSVEAKIWSPLSAEFTDIPVGALVLVEARAGTYRDQIQLTIEHLHLLDEAESAAVDPAELMPSSPFPLDEMMDELLGLLKEEFTHPGWRKLTQLVFKDEALRAAFRTCPAAKGVHHAYAGGLLEHTLSVFRLCRRFADQYAELDRQTLLAGALFHDFGKIREFSGGIANDYTDEGRLIGHLELGIEMLAPFLAKSGLDEELQRHLRHLILSHHGTAEFGAVRLPQTAEALALHFADNMDAKMAQCRDLFAQIPEGSWTPYQATLGRALYRGPRTPETTPTKSKAKGKAAPREELLSLL